MNLQTVSWLVYFSVLTDDNDDWSVCKCCPFDSIEQQKRRRRDGLGEAGNSWLRHQQWPLATTTSVDKLSKKRSVKNIVADEGKR